MADATITLNVWAALLIGVGLVCLTAGLVFLVLRRRAEKHLEALQKGLERIADGDLSYRIGSADRAATDPLAACFDALTEALSTRVAALSAEIAERSHAEEALQRSEATNRAIIDAIPDLLFRISVDGVFLDYKNPRGAQLLVQPDVFLGKSVRDVLSPALADETMDTVRRVMATGQSQGFEYQLEVDGVMREFETRHAVISDGEVLAIVRDITERKQQQELLRVALEHEKQLSDLKSRFMTLMTHEFRTPLSVILTSSDLLQRYHDRLDEEKRTKHFSMIHEQVRHLARVLDDILTLSRAETIGLELQATTISLEAVCKIAIEDVKSLLADYELVFSCPTPCPDALFDPGLIRQAVSNLLSNAAKYSPSGSAIYFDLICGGDQAVIRIRDSGIGIPEEDQQHLFNVFYRAHNTDEKPGLGLGLAIVKHAVQLHGGTIAVESEVGAGTTFTLTLPLRTEQH